MSTTDAEMLTPDGIFELLSNHRRRMVLYYLRRERGTIGVNELAEQIASLENDVPVEELTSQQRKRVYVSLYQTHLPKMAESNAIEYDKDAGTVRLSDRGNDIDAYLTTEDETRYPWTFHYFVLAVIGGSVLGLSLLDVTVFSTFQAMMLSAGILALLVTSAGVQFWRRRARKDQLPLELHQYDH